jgi:hypothetical protein
MKWNNLKNMNLTYKLIKSDSSLSSLDIKKYKDIYKMTENIYPLNKSNIYKNKNINNDRN